MISLALMLMPLAQDAPVAEQPKPKKICRTLAADTGSRLGSNKVCRTQEQWKKIDQASAGDRASGGAKVRVSN